MSLGEIILIERSREAMSQSELSEATGIPIDIISFIENDKALPSLKHLRELCKTFGLDLEDIQNEYYIIYSK